MNTVSVDPNDLVDPERWARDGYPHEVWTRLRDRQIRRQAERVQL